MNTTNPTCQPSPDVAYYRDVLIPNMKHRENVILHGWGELWNKMQQENLQLRTENEAHYRNHQEWLRYVDHLENRCRALEILNATLQKKN